MYDALIVGGGPAGLSAALILGRCRRKVLIIDEGKWRNAVSTRLSGYLSRDGEDPGKFRQTAREQLQAYDVEFRSGRIETVNLTETGFSARDGAGEAIEARGIILATGLIDVLPPIEGLADYYGKGVWHCPYCDGWEHRDRPLAVHGKAKGAMALARELLLWSRDIVLCTNGPLDLSPHHRARLTTQGIRIEERPIAAVEGDGKTMSALRFADGERLERDALFLSCTQEQTSSLALDLGCKLDEKGFVRTRSRGRTHIPRLYVSGNEAGGVLLVIAAAAHGAAAAMALNTDLMKLDLNGPEAAAPRKGTGLLGA